MGWIFNVEKIFRKVRRIKHRTDHIHMRGDLLQHLAYAEIFCFPGRHTEKVGGKGDSGRFQFRIGEGEKFSDTFFLGDSFDDDRVFDCG